ncbi:hypothetical protein J2Y58_003886 [Sphingomonas sp. BE138]|uniref:hypothetical protein n=1 Tax=Sphingomonas sp. BE138 TaxID=2817845 RepID=UPI002855D83B|nr:hypothetical protein [Sphingomonas sp. BE138]MDR6790503.1 hypothetical protein [Sphingomonas sp. BE138]
MADITDLPVMTMADAVSIGFAGFNDVPHKPIDLPDGPFTITAKTSEGRRITFSFMGQTWDGPARFVDVQFHDRGTVIANSNNGVSPTFNAFAITRGGRHITDSRPLGEDEKPSIVVVLMSRVGEEPPRSETASRVMKDRDLAALLTRAASVITAPDSEIRSHRDHLVDLLQAEAARRNPWQRPS